MVGLNDLRHDGDAIAIHQQKQEVAAHRADHHPQQQLAQHLLAGGGVELGAAEELQQIGGLEQLGHPVEFTTELLEVAPLHPDVEEGLGVALRNGNGAHERPPQVRVTSSSRVR